MAFKYRDRIRENCAPSGLGDVILSGAPVGYVTFANSGFIDGDTTIVCIVVPITGQFVICNATFNAGANSVSRGTIIWNHLGTTANVNFTGGSAGITFVGLAASQAIHALMTPSQLFSAGIQPVPDSGLLAATGTTQGTAALLVKSFTYINAGGADTGFIMPDVNIAPINSLFHVVNKTATVKKAWPDTGSNFDGLAADAMFTMNAGVGVWLKRTGAQTWYTS